MLWISDTFGGGWTSIPANNATDDLGSRVRSLRFASFNEALRWDAWAGASTAYAGGGNVDANAPRHDGRDGRASVAWPVTTSPSTRPMRPGTRSTSLSAALATYRHVWHFDGTEWQAAQRTVGGRRDQPARHPAQRHRVRSGQPRDAVRGRRYRRLALDQQRHGLGGVLARLAGCRRTRPRPAQPAPAAACGDVRTRRVRVTRSTARLRRESSCTCATPSSIRGAFRP